TREQAAPVVMYPGRLAVDGSSGAHDAGAVRRPDALVPQTDAKDGDCRPVASDHINRHPCLRGRARPRGDNDVGRADPVDLVVRRSVVASYNGLLPQLAHVTGQVEDEGVVVIDQ